MAVIACLAVAAAGTAVASEGKGGTEGGKEPSASHDSSAASSGDVSSPQAGVDANFGFSDALDRDVDRGAVAPFAKHLHLDVGWEIHAFLVSNNLVGNGAETLFNYYYGVLSYSLTASDTLSLIAGFYQFALADPGETGVRADDIVLRYTHHFALPWQLGLDAAGSILAPTSFESYKMGLVTEVGARVTLERTFLKYISVDLRAFGAWYWQTYESVGGGSTPNPVGRMGSALGVDAQLPWHHQLSAGVNLFTEYLWYYDPVGTPTGGQYEGVENNPTFSHQPLQQEYGVEAYVQYELPRYRGVQASARLAYAQGDPTAGYTDQLIGGISNLYLFYPEASQIYFNLDFKY